MRRGWQAGGVSRRCHHLVVVTIVTMLGVAMIACGADRVVCDVPRQEAPDPASGLHLLDDAEIRWEADPPTSGPHRSVAPDGGLWHESPNELDQVAFLETGGVVVLVSTRTVPDELAALAGPRVLVAPGQPNLPDEVVATAWTWRLRCSAVDVEPLRAFIEERVGAATGH